jgi:putative membrane protein (TIGR04086 family)
MVRGLAGEFRGFLVALICAMIMGTVLALGVYWSPLEETLLNPSADFTLMISIFIGGWYSAHHNGNRGLARGLTIGLMVFIFVLFMTLIANPALISFKSIFKDLLFALASGGLGGILGVGMAN